MLYGRGEVTHSLNIDEWWRDGEDGEVGRFEELEVLGRKKLRDLRSFSLFELSISSSETTILVKVGVTGEDLAGLGEVDPRV